MELKIMKIKAKTQNEQEKTRYLTDTDVINFKNRLAIVLEGMSGNAFAKKVGMSEAVIRDYLSGKTYPSLNRLAIIALKCDIPIEWLVTGKGECRLLPESKVRDVIQIPFYCLNETGKFFIKMKSIPFDINLVKYQCINSEDLTAIWNKGDSMDPTISNHDILIINKTNNKPSDGYLYAVQYDDQISVKRIQHQGCNLALLCDNPKYPTIMIDKNSPQDFKIIGRVVYLLKDLF